MLVSVHQTTLIASQVAASLAAEYRSRLDGPIGVKDANKIAAEAARVAIAAARELNEQMRPGILSDPGAAPAPDAASDALVGADGKPQAVPLTPGEAIRAKLPGVIGPPPLPAAMPHQSPQSPQPFPPGYGDFVDMMA